MSPTSYQLLHSAIYHCCVQQITLSGLQRYKEFSDFQSLGEVFLIFFNRWQPDAKLRSLFIRRKQVNRTTMLFRNKPGNGQPAPQSLSNRILRGRTPEQLKNSLLKIKRNSVPIVFNRNNYTLALLDASNFYIQRFFFIMLEGILKKMLKQQLKSLCISINRATNLHP
jgi:hypothetical protein